MHQNDPPLRKPNRRGGDLDAGSGSGNAETSKVLVVRRPKPYFPPSSLTGLRSFLLVVGPKGVDDCPADRRDVVDEVTVARHAARRLFRQIPLYNLSEVLCL